MLKKNDRVIYFQLDGRTSHGKFPATVVSVTKTRAVILLDDGTRKSVALDNVQKVKQ